jgi:hypothetical protein
MSKVVDKIVKRYARDIDVYKQENSTYIYTYRTGIRKTEINERASSLKDILDIYKSIESEMIMRPECSKEISDKYDKKLSHLQKRNLERFTSERCIKSYDFRCASEFSESSD